MPQPLLEIAKYLSTPLPALREQYPPGTGGTGPRSDWKEGTLKGVQVIDGFEAQVTKYIETLPSEGIPPHPRYKYPMFVQAITTVPSVIKSATDLQKCLSTLPLAAVSSVLTALELEATDEVLGPTGARALDNAGYESDGGEEIQDSVPTIDGKTKPWYWQFNKSPLGSGEFYLMQQGSEDVKLVVRTINSAAFTSHDWEEYVVTGPYHYTTKSKASWYWSRTWGATTRLKCTHWILTDYNRWVFGTFDKTHTHGFVSPIMSFDAQNPGVLQALLYWSRSAIGDENGFKGEKKDVSGEKGLFPPNPARRVSVSGSRPKGARDAKKVKAANESDIEESDAEE